MDYRWSVEQCTESTVVNQAYMALVYRLYLVLQAKIKQKKKNTAVYKSYFSM